MPSTTISTPEHAASISRTALGITSARDTAAPGADVGLMRLIHWCSASEDE